MSDDDALVRPGGHDFQLPAPPAHRSPDDTNRAGMWVFFGLAGVVALGTTLALVMASVAPRPELASPVGIEAEASASADDETFGPSGDAPTLPPSPTGATVTLADVPPEVDGFSASAVGEGFVVYTSPSSAAHVSVSGFPNTVELSDLVDGIDGEVTWDSTGRSACGVQGMDALCVMRTEEHGIVYVRADDSSVPAETVRAIAQGILDRNP